MSVSKIALIWESDSAIAVNKPAGLSTQTPQSIDSLETRLRRQLGRDDRYLSLPHRLDRCVSGVILVALTKKAARLLSAQFASRKTSKEYSAVVEGVFEPHSPDQDVDSLRWEDHIRKVEGRSLAEPCKASDPGAKLAVTIVKSRQIDSPAGCSRLVLHPLTGRMHQLRLQTALRGHPIVGDEAYGATKRHTAEGEVVSSAADVPQILLHAHRLGFHAPSTGRWTEVEAPCPF